jgi:hypothetical protein
MVTREGKMSKQLSKDVLNQSVSVLDYVDEDDNSIILPIHKYGIINYFYDDMPEEVKEAVFEDAKYRINKVRELLEILPDTHYIGDIEKFEWRRDMFFGEAGYTMYFASKLFNDFKNLFRCTLTHCNGDCQIQEEEEDASTRGQDNNQ